MNTSSMTSIALLVILGGCCTHMLSLPMFEKSPLEQQIRELERGNRDHCIPREANSLFLSALADHGLESADAMTELLKHPSPYFPLEDAMVVLVFVRASGTDLRTHEVRRVLANIAETAVDPEIRRKAKKTLEELNYYDSRETPRRP